MSASPTPTIGRSLGCYHISELSSAEASTAPITKDAVLEFYKSQPKLKSEISENQLLKTVDVVANNWDAIIALVANSGGIVSRDVNKQLYRTIIVDKNGNVLVSCKLHHPLSSGIGKGIRKSVTYLINLTSLKVMSFSASGTAPILQTDPITKIDSMDNSPFWTAQNEALAAGLFYGKPNLVQYHDLFSYIGKKGLLMEVKQGIVMDLYEEGDLIDFTYKFHNGHIKLNLEQMYRFLYSLCNGLATIHEMGYIHRDVKPENYLLRIVVENGEPFYEVDLGDFGFLVSSKGFDKLRNAVGSIDYLAPELWAYYAYLTNPHHQSNLDYMKMIYEPQITTAVDVYSLGVYLQILFFKRIPNSKAVQVNAGDPNLKQLAEPVDKPLEHLLWRMTRPNPTKRPTMKEVMTELKPALTDFYTKKP
jgi:serine/threonine protein kinase